MSRLQAHNSIDSLEDELRSKRPSPWDQLLEVDLYMDQLLLYINRQQYGETEQDLTKSMVNNYIKQGLIPRPHGKRYDRQHQAELIMLTMLKEVLPLPSCQSLFEALKLVERTEEVYTLFNEMLDQVFAQQAARLAEDHAEDRQAMAKDALRYAMISYAARKATIALLNDLHSTKQSSIPPQNK